MKQEFGTKQLFAKGTHTVGVGPGLSSSAQWASLGTGGCLCLL